MKLTKILAALLAVIMVVSLAACTDTGNGTVTTDTNPVEDNTTDTTTPDESTPDESTPDESTPDESTPDESTPDESTPVDETPEDAWVNDIEGGMLKNATFDDANVGLMFDQISGGVAEIVDGQLVCGDGGDFFLQCWTAYNGFLSADRFKVYIKGTQSPDGFYCIFKTPGNAPEPNKDINLLPYLNGTDMEFELDLGYKTAGTGGGICFSGNGTVTLDYLQIVPIYE